MDGRVKAPLNARAGILQTWLLGLNAERIEGHRTPAPEGYRDVRVLRRGESLPTFLDPTLHVDDLLG